MQLIIRLQMNLLLVKAAIGEMFSREFANAEMVCIPENIFENKE